VGPLEEEILFFCYFIFIFRILFVREEEGEEEGVYLQLETRERVRFLAKERELCDVMAIKNVMVRGTPEGCGGQL